MTTATPNQTARPGLRLVTVVAAALIDEDQRVLITQRPAGKPMAGLWEFPGGKIEPGETPDDAIRRELREELDIDVCPTCIAPLTFASHSYDDFHLLMPLYLCRTWDGVVRPMEGQEIAWVRANRLNTYEMPAADLPLLPALRDLFVKPL